jgi:NAD(P)-dependent dehydrogenase (short-subunit alcohol dehydrogenase family)
MMELPFKIDLSGKTAVITGGGGVLCRVFAQALAACNANIAVLDIEAEAAEKTRDRIKALGGKAISITADVLDKESLIKAEKVVSENFGSCDILINGAGGNHPGGTTSNEFLKEEDILSTKKDLITFYDLNPESIKFVFDLNFTGTLLACQVFSKKMPGKTGAVIINLSSMNALTPLTKIPAYSAAKAAVSNFTKWLAVHMSKAGIRVNAIAPGFFLTKQNRELLIEENGSFNPRAGKIIEHTPMGRFGKPEELIGTLLWLVDAKASGFVNGAVIPVDGGFSAYSGV